ncbi:MAG: hypothetical protein NTW82_12310 [Bacteroidia bacterium]|nr:hypothetical protein [Bacteroidia bacterium]
MKKNIPLFILLLQLSLPGAGQLKNNHEISMTISGLRDSSIYLAYHFGDKQYIKDTIKLDSRGHGIFSGPESLPHGIYMIVLPGRQYFEFLASDDQLFSLTCSYEDYYNTLKFTGSDENSAFIEYQKKWSALQQQAIGISKRLQTNKQNSDSVKLLIEKQKKQEEYMKSYLRNIIDANGNNLLSVLVKSMLPIEVPDFK